MKKTYNVPEIEVTLFECEDIIMTSGNAPLVTEENPIVMINDVEAAPLAAQTIDIFN